MILCPMGMVYFEMKQKKLNKYVIVQIYYNIQHYIKVTN